MQILKKFIKSALATTFTVNLLSFLASQSFSWTSPYIPKLQSNDSAINPLSEPITIYQGSLLASLSLVGGCSGILISGFITKKLGKKKTLLLAGLPMLISYLIIAFARDVVVFIVARVIMGLGVGIVFSLIPGYVGEIASENNRGFLGNFISILGSTGELFVYSLGPFMSIKAFSLLNLVPIGLFYAFFISCPESPYELVAKNELATAEKVLMDLRGSNNADAIKKELSKIVNAIEKQEEKAGNFLDLLTNKTLRKSVTITSLIMFFRQGSGLVPIFSFMESIFDSPTKNLFTVLSPVIATSIFVLSALISSQIIDKMGRKFWLIFSSVGMITSLGILGTYFYFKDFNNDLTSISWLPLFCLTLYFMSFALGFLNIPWILMGEYFPTSHKSEASTVTTMVCFATSAIATLEFSLVADLIGQYANFWIFSVILMIGIVFILVAVPETKGKTFLEIQDILKGRIS